ncbi:MAG: hypothetical protein AAGB03_11705, partial [Pseudomonadota bacterium]
WTRLADRTRTVTVRLWQAARDCLTNPCPGIDCARLPGLAADAERLADALDLTLAQVTRPRRSDASAVEPGVFAACYPSEVEAARLVYDLRSARRALSACAKRSACAGAISYPAGPQPAQGAAPEVLLDALETVTARLPTMPIDKFRLSLIGTDRPLVAGMPLGLAISGKPACFKPDGLMVSVVPPHAAPGLAPNPVGIEAALALDVPDRLQHLIAEPQPQGETGVLAVLPVEAPLRPGAYQVALLRPSGQELQEVGRSETFVVGEASAPCVGFSGIWETSFGRMHLAEGEEGEVRGTYRRAPLGQSGFFAGKRRDRVLYGQWASEFGSGGLRLVLNESDSAFTGTWSRFREEFAGEGAWTGACASGP